MADVGSVITTILPWIGTALTSGPAGLAVMAAAKIAEAIGLPKDASVAAVKTALGGMQPAEMLALKKLENEFALQMQDMGYKNIQMLSTLDVHQLEVINATMQEEIKAANGESWLQNSWRPLCGISLAAGSFVGVVFTCMLFWKAIGTNDIAALNAIPQLASALALILGIPGAVCGVTAWHRGMLQRQQVSTP